MLNSLFVLLCLCFMLHRTHGDPIKADEHLDQKVVLKEKNYFPIPGTTALYKFYETLKTFNDAKTTCENDGASLYYPETKEESKTVLRFMRNKRGLLPYGWFLGLVRSDNTFVPLNGTTKSNKYIRWDKGEPNNAGGSENCVVFVAATRKMNDVPCIERFEFICVSRPSVPEPKFFCNVSDLVRDPEMNDVVNQNRASIDKYYFPIPQSKALYKHYMIPKTLNEAKTTCENEGASLYYPETEQESNAVLSFMQHCNGSLTYGWFLGIVRSGTNFVPVTEDGTSMTNMYVQWNLGEPNNAAGSENCVVYVASQMKMNDVPCTYQFQFICKLQPRK